MIDHNLKFPLVSVIVSTLNCDRVIPKTIESFHNQDYSFKELIIIDGASKDSTYQYILENRKKIDFFLSEKDEGVYDAWNKGIENSKGQWILFLGAGDRFYTNKTISDLIAQIKNDRINFVSGKIFVEDKENVFLYSMGKKWDKRKLKNNIHIGHPGSLHHRSLFNKSQMFNANYKICGDYEFLMRVNNSIISAYYPEFVVKMDNLGISNSKPYKAIIESAKAMKNTEDFGIFLATRYITIAFIKVSIRNLLMRSLLGKKMLLFLKREN